MLIKSPDKLGGYDSLYVSPHLDDAAISCPARILEEGKGRGKVLVVTLFTAGAPDAEARQKEDRKAMTLLGVDHLWMGFTDAPWRNPLYTSFRGIVLESHADDRVFLAERLVPAMRDLLARTTPERVYFPLGVGTHIDHRLAGAGATLPAAMGTKSEVLFYEDRPYVFLLHALRMRMAELDVRLAPLPDDLAPQPRETMEASLRGSLDRTAWVKAYLGDSERRSCTDALVNRLRAASRWEGRGRGMRLRPELVRASGAILKRIEKTVAAYASQVEALFGGEFTESAVRYGESIAKKGRYVERVWKVES